MKEILLINLITMLGRDYIQLKRLRDLNILIINIMEVRD